MLLSIALPDKLPKSLIAFKKYLLQASDDCLESPDHQSIFFTFNIYSMTKIKVQSNPSVIMDMHVRVNQLYQTGRQSSDMRVRLTLTFLYFDRRNN